MKLISKCCNAQIKPIFDEEKGDFRLACKKCEKEVQELKNDFIDAITPGKEHEQKTPKVQMMFQMVLALLMRRDFDINEVTHNLSKIESQADEFIRYTKTL